MTLLPDALAAALADRYQLERELGQGGMATVFLARDVKHDRLVALKVLLPQLAQSLGADRFQREIRLAARLQHPHILPVFDSGEAAGRLWFTMPYVRGESLRDRLRRTGPLPLGEALRITREAAQALQYAHDEGVVHRDVKPENILLAADGSTLVADFGIARPVGEGAEASTRLTQTGMAIGTPAYMAPEQATGQSGIDARADQYALAVTLYEMLVGRPPFTGPSAGALIAERFTQPTPSARAARPEVPADVDVALRRALALEAGDRHPGIAAFAQALEAPAPTMAVPVTPPRSRVPMLAATVVLALLALLVARFVRHRAGADDGARTGAKVLAVLPFENLGDSADAYFAEGVANDVRSKLTQLGGLTVIARVSSDEYRHSSRRPQEIARELGADYLLTGTVQWTRGAAGTSRVRVSPELVDVGAGRTPSTRWTQPFDAALTDVFQVQADIAQKVATALGVALGETTRRSLAQAPTANLAAYDAFLKGEASSQSIAVADPPSLRRSIGFYEQAVALDSTFVLAWAQLARARAMLLVYGLNTPKLADDARAAAQRAEALDPDHPGVHLAMADYFRGVLGDNRKALAAIEAGLAVAPTNVDLLAAAALAERALGRWDVSLQHLARAAELDPRSVNVARISAEDLLYLRRYRETRAMLDRAYAISPTNLYVLLLRVMLSLAEGDLAGARQVVNAAAAGSDSVAIFAFLATYNDLYWVLDDAQQRQVLALSPAAFDDDRAVWAFVRAQIHDLRGARALALAYADTAQQAFAEELRGSPKPNEQWHALRGVSLAILGRKAEAIAEGRKALAPETQVGDFVRYYEHQVMRIHVRVGDRAQALDELEALLQAPYFLSSAWLRIDPEFTPLRGDPRFERLAAGR